MAERRMFAKSIVTSDEFLDMSPTARCLYFTLGLCADDDGFVDSPKSIMRQVGSTAKDMDILVAKQYVIAFESGVVAIRHWRLHNHIRGDRKHNTKYINELSLLELDENGAYTFCQPNDNHTDNHTDSQLVDNCHVEDRLGKVRLGNNCLDNNYFIKKNARKKQSDLNKDPSLRPTLEDIEAYISEKGLNVDGRTFYEYFDASEWIDSFGHAVKNWKQKLITWSKREDDRNGRTLPENDNRTAPQRGNRVSTAYGSSRGEDVIVGATLPHVVTGSQ